ncbi:MAG: pyridoxal-phosphate dependent enzyme [Gemmatimonadetes bacterium]|nr:pyridoxal-phosphate dependent enzyme [Gemmatimonadota bacterium]
MSKKPLLSRAALRARLEKFPRVRIAHLPTPLEEMPRLSAELAGPRILIKRDDATGLAFGGNKGRHYEYEMPHVRDAGYDVLINIMDYHSNNARMTAAAANRFGIPYVLVLRNAKGRPVQGNLLVDKLLGAELHLLDPEESKGALDYARRLAADLEAKGRKPYLLQDHVFPTVVGMISYVGCGLELLDQLEERGIGSVRIFGVAGRSLCGLILAAKNLGLDWKFTGVTVTYDVDLEDYIFRNAGRIGEMLDLPATFDRSDMAVLNDYIGEGYGIPTQEVIEAIHLTARKEAVILDPNYTGTAMAALIDQVRKGKVRRDETVVFLHTGGLPAVFTFAEELAAWEG